jgi:hemerythrin superfamily protein
MSTAPDVNAIDLVLDDHRNIEELFSSYESARSADDRLRLAHEIIRTLSVHAAIEEQFLYPLIRSAVEEGADLADDCIEDHQEVKELLSIVDKLRPSDDAFDEKVRAVIDDVREHVAEEENDVLPKLRAAVSEDRLRQTGRAMQAGKRLAPTRPHPGSPNRPPANFAVGPAAAMADRVADAVRDARKH